MPPEAEAREPCEPFRGSLKSKIQTAIKTPKLALTILCKIITRMKLLFSNLYGITLQFSGGLRIHFHYSYSFLVLLMRIHLQEIIPLSDFQPFFAITVT